MVALQHAARQIPISRPVHRNGRGAPACFARFADEVTALHLIDSVVIGVPIVAVLGAAVEDRESRARAYEGAGGKQKSRRDKSAKPPRGCAKAAPHPCMTILDVLQHLVFLTPTHSPTRDLIGRRLDLFHVRYVDGDGWNARCSGCSSTT